MLGSYPCALGYAYSSVFLKINKLANGQGIVFKNAAVMEQLHKISLGVFSRHKDNSNNSIDLVQLTALNSYLENSVSEFLADGSVRSVVDLKPKEKAELIQSLRWGGERTLVYGNKISDMPLLACGDVGIALQNNVTEQFAQVVLQEENLKLILTAIDYSAKLKKAFKRNLIIALLFNILALPIAIGIWYVFGGLLLEPILLAGIMLCGGVGVLINSKCLK
jgi:Cu+-exporting ATPase